MASAIIVHGGAADWKKRDLDGAVAMDEQGNLAAAVSTGGTKDKMPGRVGDSALAGCGAYADNQTAAAVATGSGEGLMKVVISKRVCDFVGMGMAAQAACEAAIQLLSDRLGESGGLIAIDACGCIGIKYNTRAMPHAYALGEAAVVAGQ